MNSQEQVNQAPVFAEQKNTAQLGNTQEPASDNISHNEPLAKWSNQRQTKLPNKKFKFPKVLPKILFTIGGLALIALIVSIFFYKPKVVVTNNSSDAVLTIDGNIINQAKISLPLGNHKIILSRPGYIPNITDQKLSAFQTIKINHPLRPIPSAKALVSESAFAADFSSNGKTFFYLGNGGRTLYKVTITTNSAGQKVTQKKPITPDVLPSIKSVLFSPDFSVAIFKKTDGDTGMYDFKRYDLLNQSYSSWGKDIGSIAWSPDSSLVAYYYAPSTGERSIITSDKTHEQVTRIFDLRTIEVDGPGSNAHDKNSPKVFWSSDGKTIAVIANKKLYLLDVATHTLTPITKNAGITDFQFSPDNKYLLFTQDSHLVWQSYQPVTALTDPNDRNHVGQIKVGQPNKISVNAQASKVVFDKDQTKIVALTADKGIKQVSLNSFNVQPFYLKNDLSKVTDLGLSNDNKYLYALDGQNLLIIPLDLGKYPNG